MILMLTKASTVDHFATKLITLCKFFLLFEANFNVPSFYTNQLCIINKIRLIRKSWFEKSEIRSDFVYHI
jgi:hypothetical protein